jgi:3D (Asp-Asp-Asp) domain-containing protein
LLQFGTKRFLEPLTGARTKFDSVTVHAVVVRRSRSRILRLAGLALATAFLTAGLVAASSALASQTASRGGPGSNGDTREHQALLALYALDSRLAASRARVEYLSTEAARLRRERRVLRSELHAARSRLATMQGELALELRTLYERGEVDSLAVVFGAASLGKGMRELDELKLSAAQSTRVVVATRRAARRLSRARRALGADARRLARSLAFASAAEQSLAETAASKSAYVASLRGAGTAGLLSAAQSATQASQEITHGRTPPQPPPKGGRKMVVSATCYILRGTTATGVPAGPGVVAVDPNVIPLGTRMYVPGYGKGVAADVGGGIKGKIIDLWYSTYAQCAKWGRRTVTITLY